MKVWLGKDIQMKLAAEGLCIPMVKGTADAIQNPFYKALALEVNHSDWICSAMDQLLGRETGRVFNDEAAAVAIGAHSPEQATKTIENSWSKSRIGLLSMLLLRGRALNSGAIPLHLDALHIDSLGLVPSAHFGKELQRA
jgi:hypothetical protein